MDGSYPHTRPIPANVKTATMDGSYPHTPFRPSPKIATMVVRIFTHTLLANAQNATIFPANIQNCNYGRLVSSHRFPCQRQSCRHERLVAPHTPSPANSQTAFMESSRPHPPSRPTQSLLMSSHPLPANIEVAAIDGSCPHTPMFCQRFILETTTIQSVSQ